MKMAGGVQHILLNLQVIEVDPSSGKVLHSVDFPKARMITSACFGGRDYDVMFVTSARTGDPEALRDEAGAIFKITGFEDGVRGERPAEFPREALKALL